MGDAEAAAALNNMSMYLARYYGRRVIILLDEYDTPMQEALRQIAEKKYDAELLALGVPKERIRHYGFAFAGKKVLIGA